MSYWIMSFFAKICLLKINLIAFCFEFYMYMYNVMWMYMYDASLFLTPPPSHMHVIT